MKIYKSTLKHLIKEVLNEITEDGLDSKLMKKREYSIPREQINKANEIVKNGFSYIKTTSSGNMIFKKGKETIKLSPGGSII